MEQEEIESLSIRTEKLLGERANRNRRGPGVGEHRRRGRSLSGVAAYFISLVYFLIYKMKGFA